jgi:hypothetical protein
MLHKIRDLCDKIDTIKEQADRLRAAKYGPNKTETVVLDMMIETIQADCLLIAHDKSKYTKDKDAKL